MTTATPTPPPATPPATLRVIHRPPTTAADAAKYWAEMDAIFKDTMGQAKKGFRMNLVIGAIVVGIGVIMVLYSLVYSAWKGLDVNSVAFGSAGVVTFITTFFFTTQKSVQKAVANLATVQILYKAFNTVWESVNDWLPDATGHTTLTELKDVDKLLTDSAKDLATAMQATVEK